MTDEDPLSQPAGFGFGVWLMPARGESPRLTASLEPWSPAHDAFRPPPHVTLLARLASADLAKAVARRIRFEPPLHLKLGPAERGAGLWRALARPVVDGAAVQPLRDQACAAASVAAPGDFHPHLSLAYVSPDMLAPDPMSVERDAGLTVAFDRVEVWDLRRSPREWEAL